MTRRNPGQEDLTIRKGQYDEPLVGHRRPRAAGGGRRPKRKAQKLSKLLYIATLINPVDHKLYTVIWNMGDLWLISPTNQDEVEVWGTGSLAEDDFPAQETNCPRTHTPGGVVVKGVGLGLILYSGLALAAAMGSQMSRAECREYDLPDMEPCVSSSDKGPGRSSEADEWWEKQVSLGFAKKWEVRGELEDIRVTVDADDIGYDEDRILSEIDRKGSVSDISGQLSGHISYMFYPEDIEAQVIQAENVFKKGLVFHWNDNLKEEAAEARDLDKDVLLEIDLEGMEEPHLLEVLIEKLDEAGASEKEIHSFLRRNGLLDQPRLPGLDIGEPDPYSKMHKNPAKHSAAWRKVFGDLITDRESPAIENRSRRR